MLPQNSIELGIQHLQRQNGGFASCNLAIWKAERREGRGFEMGNIGHLAGLIIENKEM